MPRHRRASCKSARWSPVPDGKPRSARVSSSPPTDWRSPIITWSRSRRSSRKTYRLEYTAADGSHGDLRVLGVDLPNDLAIVRLDKHDAPFFSFDPVAISGNLAKGERLYSMGNPLDLGFTIMEGTYNGLVEHSYTEQILVCRGAQSRHERRTDGHRARFRRRRQRRHPPGRPAHQLPCAGPVCSRTGRARARSRASVGFARRSRASARRPRAPDSTRPSRKRGSVRTR